MDGPVEENHPEMPMKKPLAKNPNPWFPDFKPTKI
jgi:hypothetical protein